ncbi:cytoplasmic protein [Cryptococcus neoformans]|nr:cytoplasmic protein [Cryptococcus neoformans var. grubii]OXC60285.1 cytoplasmic protein [Cryptococcus neoformans var. grubii MW-RSA852]
MPESPRTSSPAFKLDDSASITNADNHRDVLDTIELNDNNDYPIDPWKVSEASTSAPSPSRGTSYTGAASFSHSHSSSLQKLSVDRTNPEETGPSANPARTAATTSLPAHWVNNGEIPTVLGIAVVDFNHLIGPTVEYAFPPSLQNALSIDENLSKELPFLALPDGAHLSEEDYSYFHCTFSPSNDNSHQHNAETNIPTNQTLFGISCNRQLASAELHRRPSDVTRSMVQKAIVVIASHPIFGPIRDRLGVVTRAYFAQRDFGETKLLEDFYTSLETSLEGKSGEEAIYMGTSLRELVHKFRHRTLVLLKMLMLQKRVMLFGYPVEKLCTYQYSLVSLIPGLLLNLRDSGSPQLEQKRSKVRPTSLRTSDRTSLLRFMGLPLRIFSHDAFFQPYMPLQQMDTLAAKSWLVGTTNQIVTQQKECRYDLLVNIDNNTFVFPNPKLERVVGLTAADRKWMDDVVQTVEETWGLSEGERPSYRGSDDDLRARFEEYIFSALSSIKYSNYLSQTNPNPSPLSTSSSNTPSSSSINTLSTMNRDPDQQGLVMAGLGGTKEGAEAIRDFGEGWVGMFRETKVYEIWNGSTDETLFDIHEPRHPCEGKVNVVSDLSLRISEGLHDLRLDEQLGPTREALSSAFSAGSSSLFRAFDGVRSEVSNRLREREEAAAAARARQSVNSNNGPIASETRTPFSSTTTAFATNVSSTQGQAQTQPVENIRATLGGIGSGIGGFFSSRISNFRNPSPTPTTPKGLRPMSLSSSASTGSLKGMARLNTPERQGK